MASLLNWWKKRLPKEKTEEELDEHYDRMEQMDLEKGDFFAMIVGAFMALWPVLLIVAAIVLIPMLIFRVF